MKKIIGFLIAFFSIAFIILIILKVWNVTFIGWADILRSVITLALFASVVILLLVNVFFFKEVMKLNKKNFLKRKLPVITLM